MPKNDEIKFKISVGENIRSYRTVSQEVLAESAQISPDTLSLIERGENTASSYTLVKICNALKITPNHILKDFIVNKHSAFDSIILHELCDLTPQEKEHVLSTITFIKHHKK